MLWVVVAGCEMMLVGVAKILGALAGCEMFWVGVARCKMFWFGVTGCENYWFLSFWLDVAWCGRVYCLVQPNFNLVWTLEIATDTPSPLEKGPNFVWKKS